MKTSCHTIAAVLVLASWMACLAADPSAPKRDDAAAEKLGFRLSLQCWTFRELTFFETVDKAAGLGVKYLEAYPGQRLKPGSNLVFDRNMSDDVCKDIRRKLAAAGGLKLVAYGVGDVPTDEKAARKLFDWAKRLGIEVLVTETTPNDVHDRLCTEYHIKLALHNHPATWPTERVLAACKGHCKLIGACGDTGHWMRANRVPVDMLKKLAGRIMHLHFKDLDRFGAGHDVPWGTGKADVRGMMAELKRQGYRGYFSIEYEYGSLPELAVDLPKCVAFFDRTAAELAK
jgi:sugar phosphate isomerase/epimerase